MIFKNIYNKLHAILNQSFLCSVCNKKTHLFLPLSNFFIENLEKYGYIYSLDDAETLNYKAYSCPSCGASDRDRLYAVFISKYLKQRKYPNITLLDIAPSAPLGNHLKSIGNISLRTADLMMKGVDDCVDITNMSCYADEKFDFLICSHVLEHVPDDLKAMSELYRILKPNGCGILMVPILLALDQIDEDPFLEDVGERWRRFGQDDHVRMYSKNGFVSRLESVGFIVRQYTRDYFGSEVFHKYGISDKSVLYIVEKPLSSG